MHVDYIVLASEIENDPAGLGYASYVQDGDDEGLARLINQRPETFSPPKAWTTTNPSIPLASVLIWGGSTGVRANIQQAATSSGAFATAPAQLQAICQTVLDLLQGAVPVFDMSNQNNVNMIGYLVSAKVMTPDQAASLSQLAVQPASRAEVLFGYQAIVTHTEIAVSMGRIG